MEIVSSTCSFCRLSTMLLGVAFDVFYVSHGNEWNREKKWKEKKNNKNSIEEKCCDPFAHLKDNNTANNRASEARQNDSEKMFIVFRWICDRNWMMNKVKQKLIRPIEWCRKIYILRVYFWLHKGVNQPPATLQSFLRVQSSSRDSNTPWNVNFMDFPPEKNDSQQKDIKNEVKNFCTLKFLFEYFSWNDGRRKKISLNFHKKHSKRWTRTSDEFSFPTHQPEKWNKKNISSPLPLS